VASPGRVEKDYIASSVAREFSMVVLVPYSCVSYSFFSAVFSGEGVKAKFALRTEMRL
jgi:hypothetical protein